jgi:hypothetical protein
MRKVRRKRTVMVMVMNQREEEGKERVIEKRKVMMQFAEKRNRLISALQEKYQ